MIRDVLSHLDYSLCAEVALVLFVLSFLGVMVQVFLTGREFTEHAAELPLDEGSRGGVR
jgi:hypothetical protein